MAQYFRNNLNKYGTNNETVTVCTVDSTTIDDEFVLEKLGQQRVRMFSVDGGHTVEHVMHDLAIAESTLTSGGVVMLDDYYNPNWAGVTEGLVRFMLLCPVRIMPFGFCASKLMLTTPSHRDRMFSVFRDDIEALEQDYNIQTMFSHEVVVVRPDVKKPDWPGLDG